MNILIVIVNHNGKKLLEKTLPSILKTNTNDFNLEICVVDNNSSDDSVTFLEEQYPAIKIIKSNTNLGYGRAHNLALEKYPDYDNYVFMNNDIAVQPNWLENLLEVVRNKQNVGAVGPKILLSEKKENKENSYVINSAGMDIDKHYMAYDRYQGEENTEKYNVVETVDGICGAVMLVPKEVLKKVRGFSPNMFLYYEDVDLSLRIRDEGYDIYYCGQSVVYHDHMASTENIGSFKRNWMNMKNRYVSIKYRKGFSVAMKETIWYLYSWMIWKIFHSKKISLKTYLDDK
jgi:GT2 family glycosyltransferase